MYADEILFYLSRMGPSALTYGKWADRKLIRVCGKHISN